MTHPLPPRAALAYAARLLEAEGFFEAARNARGDSLYLRRADSRWHLRLSNHARTPRQRRNHPEVATSLVISAPRSTRQIEASVAAAVRDFARRAARRAASSAPSADGADEAHRTTLTR